MKAIKECILIFSGDRSKIEFGLYNYSNDLELCFTGGMRNIHKESRFFFISNKIMGHINKNNLDVQSYNDAFSYIITWLECQKIFRLVKAFAYDLPQFQFPAKPALLSGNLIDHLKEQAKGRDQHYGEMIRIIISIKNRYPAIPQIAYFESCDFCKRVNYPSDPVNDFHPGIFNKPDERGASQLSLSRAIVDRNSFSTFHEIRMLKSICNEINKCVYQDHPGRSVIIGMNQKRAGYA